MYCKIGLCRVVRAFKFCNHLEKPWKRSDTCATLVPEPRQHPSCLLQASWSAVAMLFFLTLWGPSDRQTANFPKQGSCDCRLRPGMQLTMWGTETSGAETGCKQQELPRCPNAEPDTWPSSLYCGHLNITYSCLLCLLLECYITWSWYKNSVAEVMPHALHPPPGSI